MEHVWTNITYTSTWNLFKKETNRHNISNLSKSQGKYIINFAKGINFIIVLAEMEVTNMVKYQ